MDDATRGAFGRLAGKKALVTGGTRGIAINAIAPGGTRTDMAAENGKHYIPPALRGCPARH